MLPLRLFSSRGFSVANVIGLTFTIGMFGTVFLLSQYLQIVQGYTPLEAGLRTLPWTAAPMVVAPIAGALAPRDRAARAAGHRAGAADRRRWCGSRSLTENGAATRRSCRRC